MKTFEDLDFFQKEDAIKFAEYHIVDAVASGFLELTIANPKTQELLDHVLTTARKSESPRLIKIYLLGEKSIRQEICKLAIVAASSAEYSEKGLPLTNGEVNDNH